MNYPKVSIIILNWNGLKDTRECLDSLKKVTYPNFGVVVVDNGSEREEYLSLKKDFGGFTQIIRSSKNLGFTGGCNLGIRRSQGEYVLLLNNDTVVESNFLEPLITVMEQDKKIGAVQPKARYFYEKNHFDYAGAAGGFIDVFGYPFARGRVFYGNEQDRGQYDEICPIFWASGVAMFIRRSAFEKIGFFDPIYFNYFEELDFCWRLWTSGFSIVSVPSSVIYHKVATSAKRNMFLKSYFEHRNNLILLLKNCAVPDLFLSFFGRVILDGVTLFYYLFTGRFQKCLALLVAHGWLVTHFPLILSKRNPSSKHLRMTKLPVYRGSIAWKYFICGKKTYQEIIEKKNVNF